MGLVSGFVVFFIIWWIALFTVLPFSLVRDETGKPDDPKLRQKFIFTTMLSVALWVVVYSLIAVELIDFRAIAEMMAQEDVRGDI